MDKFICKHCNFSLIIKKSSDNTKISKISTPTEFINSTKNEEQQDYDITLDKTDLETFLTKKNTKPDEKKRLFELYDQMSNKKKTITKFILKCSTCGSEYPLVPETTIYSLNFKKQQSSFNDDYIDLKLYDPTLPRTKDYVCENSNCETNVKGFDTSRKEAVMYRSSGSYHMKYACVNCKTSWTI